MRNGILGLQPVATADRTGMSVKFYSQYSKLEVNKYECCSQKGKKIDTTDGNVKRREFLKISKLLYGHEKSTTEINYRFLRASDAVARARAHTHTHTHTHIYMGVRLFIYIYIYTHIHRRTPISAGNTFQDVPRLREAADNTERYT